MNNGFNFENCIRNDFLEGQGYKAPSTMKTGTTIVGLTYKDGIVLGADTRATNGPIVADKNCEKIHYIAPNIYCCGAGTSADTENTTEIISSQLALHRLNTGRQSRVATACKMLKQLLFRYQGHIGAHLILGGVDVDGPHLYTIHNHGSVDKLPYVTMGSGSLAAMAIFEAGYKDDLEKQEAIDLVEAAIRAGIFNDLGSGSNIDINIISREADNTVKLQIERNYRTPNERKFPAAVYNFPKGTSAVLTESFTPITLRKDILIMGDEQENLEQEMEVIQ